MAKKKDVNIDELDDESGKSGKLVSILVAMLIIVIWLVIFALLIKMNVGGIGSSLRPYLKNVPVVNKILPAATDEEIQEEIRKYAVRAFKAIDGHGLSRVDFFLDKKTNHVYLNEINTLPGFTSISMYPQLMEDYGYSYSELLDKLIEIADEN